jgi:prepilin-type processing-associated H-X9-DG protein
MSILLPALKRAKENGQRAVCMSNSKQLSVALELYLMENKDRYPGWVQTWTNVVGPCPADAEPWIDMLLKYIDDSVDVRDCPAYKGIEPPVGDYWRFIADYAYNYDGAGTNLGFGHAADYSDERRPPKRSDVTNPSARVVFTEVQPRMSNNCGPEYRACYSYVGDYDPSQMWTDWFGNRLSVREMGLVNQHGNGGNYSFADTHVEWLKEPEASGNKALWIRKARP